MTPAERLEAQALLNCFLRESDQWTMEADTDTDTTVLRIPLAHIGREIVVEVTYRSATARHQFALPALLRGRDATPDHELDLPLLTSLLIDAVGGGSLTLFQQIFDSIANVDHFLTVRRDDIERLWSADPLTFIESEQALLLGHLLHPTPKSRTEMSPVELERFSPETQGSFALRWFRVDRSVLHERSASATSASDLLLQALETDPAVDPGALASALEDPLRFALVPAHPWEADLLLGDPALTDLFTSGLVTDVGTLGSPFTPTTSIRSVYSPTWPWMLKFSLHVRVTNSMRVTLPKELDRAVEAAELGGTSVGTRATEIAPDFVLLQDPAYVGVIWNGVVIDGFSVLLRENRWPADADRVGRGDVSALTTLCQDHPLDPNRLSRLGSIVSAIAAREDRPVGEVGRAWFARFVEVATTSMVRLYLELGLTFEPHQQNTLVELEDGWPVRCVYRDSQGYFHRELAHDDLVQIIPGLGEVSESIFPEDLADERLTYYLFINLTLGVVNALGTARVADEGVLLADLRTTLEGLRAEGSRYPATLVDAVLDPERLPCKANLRTRAKDMDELVGDIATQSVYVSIPNPLHDLAAPPRPPARSGGETAHQSTGIPSQDGGLEVRLVPVDPKADVELVHAWMNEPHVVEFWQMAWPLEKIGAYLREQCALDHLQPWIAWVDGRAIAYVETYDVDRDPLAEHFTFEPADRGWHVLVGPPDAIGSGAPRAVGRAVLQMLFALPDTERVVCEPDVRNARMIRFCQHLGHDVVAEIDLPDKQAALLVCTRARFEELIAAHA